MPQIQINNVRIGTDVHIRAKLTDSGVHVDWSQLSEIKAYIFSESQRQIAGKCSVEIEPLDSEVLLCVYPATEPQFLGVQSLVVTAVYDGQAATFDKKAFCFVATTDETSGTTTVEDDTVEVDIDVAEVDASILAGAIKAALDAADAANAAAAAAQIASFEDTTDPTDAEYQDEYQRVLRVLYQAITDALQVKREATEAANAAHMAASDANAAAGEADVAAGEASSAAGSARSAATEASDATATLIPAAAAARAAAELANEKAASAASAATNANTAASAATSGASDANDAAAIAAAAAELADDKAGYASEQGDYAKEQGDYAKGEIDGAKGDFESLDARFDATEQAAITLDETTDPADAEYQDEYQRVLAVAYQAISDLKQTIEMGKDAAAYARRISESAAGEAVQGAEVARSAAEKATHAGAIALDKAQVAQDAADAANAAAAAARGDYASLDDRLDAIETGKQDVIEDLESIRSGAEKGATAVQPEDLKTVATTGDYNDLENKPSKLSDFDNDVAVVFEENDNPASLIS